MAVLCQHQCRDDATSGRIYISWPFEHVLCPFRSQESPKPQAIQESLDKEKREKQKFDEHFLSKCVRRYGEESEFAPQKRTERLRMALGERVKRSKDALKTTISASKNIMDLMRKRIQERLAKKSIKFPHLCGRRRSMSFYFLRVSLVWTCTDNKR